MNPDQEININIALKEEQPPCAKEKYEITTI